MPTSAWTQRIRLARAGLAGLSLGARAVAAPLDLALRLWLAQIFFVSGVLKAANWDNALFLARYEYPVSWLDPVSAAWIGVGIELLGSVLLAAGLATRVAAGAMLALTLVIQFDYLALDAHLFWAVLFATYVVRGAGAISLDHAVARGLADSAIPLAGAAVQLARTVRERVAPWVQCFLRVWLAASMAIALGVISSNGMPSESLIAIMLPIRSAGSLPDVLLVPGALLLAVGLGTRAYALILLASLALGQLMDPRAGEHWYWMLGCALFALHGPGRLALDNMLLALLPRLIPALRDDTHVQSEQRPHVVIVGAGFGGLTCAAQLRDAPVRVTLIDRHNYHLFQPLLYQIATAGLSPGDIATPIRGLFREHRNTSVQFGEVTAVDTVRKQVCLGERRIPYDVLVLATGASHSYFGRDEWSPYAPGLKRVEDATEVRRRLLTAFELAEAADDEVERRSLLTFVIVGGGPTGVELAGAIAELARFGMEKEFRRFDPASAEVVLVQAGPRILPAFPEALSERSRRALERLGVRVLLDSRVERIDEGGVMVNGGRIQSRTVLWAAGVVASPAARWLGSAADNAGRVKVGPDLTVAGLPEVYAIGDTALSLAWKGKPVPGLAPAAKQAGDYVAKAIQARVEGRPAPGPFVYRHLGSLATIGRKAAVADFGRVRVWGAPAWWLWGVVHVGFLVGLRNRFSVMLDWFWSYLTFRGGTRLITGGGMDAVHARDVLRPETPVPKAA